jgi:hypothetical protein
VTGRQVYNDQIKQDEMGRTCSTHGAKRHKLDLKEIGLGGMDWIDLAQDRDQWRVLVNTVINLRVP